LHTSSRDGRTAEPEPSIEEVAAPTFAQIVALITEDFKVSIQGLQKSRLSGFKSVKTRGTGGGRGGGVVEPSGGIPEPVDDEATGRIGQNERHGERIGKITIIAERRRNGDTYEIDVWGLFGDKGRSKDTQNSQKSTAIRNVMEVVRSFQAEGKASGAKELKVRGLAIGDENILKDGKFKLAGLATSLGGTARVTGPDSRDRDPAQVRGITDVQDSPGVLRSRGLRAGAN
jgi:hypothetical protein